MPFKGEKTLFLKLFSFKMERFFFLFLIFSDHLLSFASESDLSKLQLQRHEVQQLYDRLISNGKIKKSYGLKFLPNVKKYYNKHVSWLDAGCGQCSVVHDLLKSGRDAYGVEVSPSALKGSVCQTLVQAQRVQHSSLISIPHALTWFLAVMCWSISPQWTSRK